MILLMHGVTNIQWYMHIYPLLIYHKHIETFYQMVKANIKLHII